MATATFHYRAITADGKVRSGVITADDSKTVARQLVRQGLTPVYVGFEDKKTNGISIKLPQFASNRRKDVLFFTQELSTLLNSGVPLDRALSIASELTNPVVVDLWKRFEAACRYEIPSNLPEFQSMFAHFAAI